MVSCVQITVYVYSITLSGLTYCEHPLLAVLLKNEKFVQRREIISNIRKARQGKERKATGRPSSASLSHRTSSDGAIIAYFAKL